MHLTFPEALEAASSDPVIVGGCSAGQLLDAVLRHSQTLAVGPIRMPNDQMYSVVPIISALNDTAGEICLNDRDRGHTFLKVDVAPLINDISRGLVGLNQNAMSQIAGALYDVPELAGLHMLTTASLYNSVPKKLSKLASLLSEKANKRHVSLIFDSFGETPTIDAIIRLRNFISDSMRVFISVPSTDACRLFAINKELNKYDAGLRGASLLRGVEELADKYLTMCTLDQTH